MPARSPEAKSLLARQQLTWGLPGSPHRPGSPGSPASPGSPSADASPSAVPKLPPVGRAGRLRPHAIAAEAPPPTDTSDWPPVRARHPPMLPHHSRLPPGRRPAERTSLRPASCRSQPRSADAARRRAKLIELERLDSIELRRQVAYSAAFPSPISWWFNTDGERASA